MVVLLIFKELLLMGDKFWISVDLPIKLSRRKGALRRKKCLLKLAFENLWPCQLGFLDQTLIYIF